jgi:O-antigen/teichoic acid export membrane protein
MVRRAFLWTILAQFLSFGISFAAMVFLTRLLTPREMGIYAVALATYGAFQVIATFGVGNFIVRVVDPNDDVLTTAFTVNAILNTALSVLIMIISSSAGQFLDDPAVAQVLRLLAIAPLIAIFDLRPSSMLQRGMQFQRISIVTVSQTIASALATVGAALAGASYMSAGYGAIAFALAGSLGYSLLGRQYVGMRLGLRDWRTMVVFGLRMMSIGGISALAARLSDIVVGRMLGLAALGLFSRASSINMMLFQNVYGAATRVIFAKLSQVYRDTGELHDTYLRAMRTISGIMGPILIGLAVLAKPAILVLYGERWLGAATPLSLLLIAQFMTLRFAMHWELFVIKDELRVQTKIEAIRSIFSVVSRVAGSLISLVTAAAASIIDALLALFLYGRQINRMIGATDWELTKISLEMTALAGIAAAPSIVVMISYHWAAGTPLLLIAGSIAVGAALWLAGIAWLRHPLFDELRLGMAMLRRRLAGRDRALHSHLGDY